MPVIAVAVKFDITLITLFNINSLNVFKNRDWLYKIAIVSANNTTLTV